MSALAGRIATVLGLRLVPTWVGDLALALVYGITWVEPERLGAAVPGDLRILLLFEALAIHATPFIYAVRHRVLPRWVLLIYVPFAVVAGLEMRAPLVLVLFLWHLVSSAWQEQVSHAQFGVAMVRYVVVVLAFLAGSVAVLLPFPDLGWVAGAVPSEYAWERGSGELIYRAVPTFGTLYFTARAAWHFLWWRWERSGAVADMERQLSRSA